MKNNKRDLLLRVGFNVARFLFFLILYITPIFFLYILDKEKNIFKFFFNINVIFNIFFMGFAIIFSNFISLKIFRKIEKNIYKDE